MFRCNVWQAKYSTQGSHVVLKVFEKVLNCEIGFQDLEKVLTLAKMCIKY